MTSSRPSLPIRRPGGSSASPARPKRNARRRRWPALVTIATSILGVIVAIVASNTPVAQTRMIIALGGFVVVIVVGTVMLFIQRVLDVGVARLSGTALISRFDLLDKFAFSLLLAASVANGVVVALQVARQ